MAQTAHFTTDDIKVTSKCRGAVEQLSINLFNS